MPAKKQTARKETKTKKPSASHQQGDLFQADPTTTDKNVSGMIQVTFLVPQGVPITLGASGLPEQKPASQPAQTVLKAIGRLTREETRKVVAEAKLSHTEIINLTTALHGQLYRLASIGGKVTRR